MPPEFEWDPDKDAANIAKLGVGFATAARIFEGPTLTAPDTRKAYGEARDNSIGKVDGILVLMVRTRNAWGASGSFRHVPRNDRRDSDMTKRYAKELTPAELAAQTDDAIDTSDVPELDETFWRNARIVEPEGTVQVTLRVKQSVLQAFKATGKGYQTRMNAVLEAYARTLRG